MKKFTSVTVILAVAMLLAFGIVWAKSSDRTYDTWLGVFTQSIDYRMAKDFDLPVKYGAIINSVVDNSPAEEAGLEEDDVIIGFNDGKITDSEDLTDMVDESKAGDEATLRIIRDGEEMLVKVTLDERKQNKRTYSSSGTKRIVIKGSPHGSKSYTWHSDSHGSHGYIGVGLTGLSRQLGDYFGVEKGDGALITSVEEDSPAEEAGLKAGDVIVKVDGDKVNDPGDVSDAVSDKEEGEQVELTLLRDRKEMTMTVEVTESETGGSWDFYGGDWDDLHIITPGMPNLPSLPSMKGLYLGDFDDEALWDTEEFRDEMEELKRELKELRNEDGEMKDIRRELKKLKKELQELYDKLD